MSVKVINESAGIDGLVPTFLVFGAFLRIITRDTPTADIITRAEAIKRQWQMYQISVRNRKYKKLLKQGMAPPKIFL